MGKFSGYLLASDFDGTLADSDGSITPQVREKLRYYIAEGGLFTVCTGRTKQGFHLYSPEIINAPVLLANGIMAYDYAAGKTMFCYGVSAESALIVRALAGCFPDICIELYNVRFASYAIRPNDRSRGHFARQDITWREIGDVEEADAPFVKIMLSTGVERGRQVQRWLDGVIGSYGLKYIPSNGEYVEIIHRDADKGRGLKLLAERLGIAENRIYAVGDGENDLDMLNAAAVSFVPENGCAVAKAAADRIVRSNDEGAVAHVIELLETL